MGGPGRYKSAGILFDDLVLRILIVGSRLTSLASSKPSSLIPADGFNQLSVDLFVKPGGQKVLCAKYVIKKKVRLLIHQYGYDRGAFRWGVYWAVRRGMMVDQLECLSWQMGVCQLALYMLLDTNGLNLLKQVHLK